MPPSRPTDHRIDLVQDHEIPGQKLYRLSTAEDKELQEQLSSLEKLGFIEPSVSPFGSGVLFVPKPNGKFRLCVDYRPLNAITVADVYPLPRIDEMIDKAVGSRWFSKMDLHAGFHQIRVHEARVERTAFNTKYGTYQFKVMPFWLCNAPATFQRTMDFVLQDLRWMVGAYVDDIFTGTDTLEDMCGVWCNWWI